MTQNGLLSADACTVKKLLTAQRRLGFVVHWVTGPLFSFLLFIRPYGLILQRLPVLSHIAPPAVRRTELSANFIHNFQRKPHVPVHQDIFNHPVSRLPSRRPIWSIDTYSSTKDLWRSAWESDLPANFDIIDDPTFTFLTFVALAGNRA